VVALDDPVAQFVPEWGFDAAKSRVTLGQLASHSSGLDDATETGVSTEKLRSWKSSFWKRGTDLFSTVRDEVPFIAEPGTKFYYSSPGIGMLAYALTAAAHDHGYSDLRTLLSERIYRPIGLGPSDYSIGYRETHEMDGLQLVPAWGGGAFTPRALARIGRLTLRHGDWEGEPLLSREAVRTLAEYPRAVKPERNLSDPIPLSGLGWFSNRDKVWPELPRDAFCAAGAGHQLLLVVPSLDLIVVRNGNGLVPEDGDVSFWKAAEEQVFNPIVAAITEPPYPPSSTVRSVEFAPVPSIKTAAVGSDNWPITWGEDDHLYTAYGDGWGFKPTTEKKLSLGIARVAGTPDAFKGTNIRSPSIERTGDGPKGPKASGLIMVDGTLYMWVRNTNNSTLCWSEDGGSTWQWGFTFTTSFGCPTFLNFGPNYSGARDSYVYTYSQDGPGAYEPYDGLVLARVPADRIREQSAYSYFAGFDSSGKPVWTDQLSGRKPVFNYPGHCERADVVFSPGINRYLLALSFGSGEGWGIFDAPEPWGPWTTAFYTPDWGLGQTHGYRLPAKWLSKDGRSMYVVFSGRRYQDRDYDAFSVRRAELQLYERRDQSECVEFAVR
jgi:hypothetical protein